MKVSTKALLGTRLTARDASVWRVDDLCFDDEAWRIRYFVLSEADRLSGKERLVSPGDVECMEGAPRRISMTRGEIEKCPALDERPTVSRQFDVGRSAYYGNPTFRTWVARAAGDPHLRSADITLGYTVQASDGACGTLTDLVIESDGWAVYRLVVEAPWPSRARLELTPESVASMDWPSHRLTLRGRRDSYVTPYREASPTR